MKKALIALLVLSMFGTAAFAQEAVTFSAAGNAQLWWGMDLDTSFTGFKIVNDNIKVSAAIGKPADLTKSGEGSYGMISIGGVKLVVDGFAASGDYYQGDWNTAVKIMWGDIVAKLVLGPAVLTFYQSTGPDFTFTGNGDDMWLTNAFNYDIYSGIYGADDIAIGSIGKSYETWNDIYFDSPARMKTIVSGANNTGFDFAFTAAGIASFGAVISSNGDWTNNTLNQYAFKAYASLLAVDGLTVNAAVNMSTAAGTNIGFGGKLAYAIKAGDISITPVVAVDYQGTAYGIEAGLRAEFMKSVLTVNFGMDEASNYGLAAALSLGMVDGLTFQTAFEMDQASDMGIFFNLGYAIKADTLTISPFVKGSYDTYVTDSFFLKAGIDVSGLLANTTFSILWESDDMMATTAILGYLKAGCKVSF